MARTERFARTSLKEFEPTFARIVSSALRRFVDEQAERRHAYTPRTEASIIHDYMRFEARRLLADHPRVKLVEKRNAFLLCVDGDWVIKLKKLDRALRTANVPTQAVIHFLHQQAGQLELDGVSPRPTSLNLGYLRERDAAEITNAPIYIVCPDGRRKPTWDWPLEGLGEAIAELGIAIEVREAEADAAAKTDRVKAKAAPLADVPAVVNNREGPNGSRA